MNRPADILQSDARNSAAAKYSLRPGRGLRSLKLPITSQAIALAYAAWALPLMLLLACNVPPWTNTDETFHMLRAVSIAHGHMLGMRFENTDPSGPPGSGGLSDIAIFQAFKPLSRLAWLPGRPDGEVTRDVLTQSEAVKWHRQMVPVWFGTTAQYPPIFYIADAVGYWIGRAAHAHVDATLAICRSLNAFMFVGLATTAIARARRLRLLLMAILMLPMTIALAASANQDAGMIAVMALAVSQLDRIADEKRSARRAELACIAAALACVAMGRPPYAALLLVLLPIAPGGPGRIAATMGAAATGVWCTLVALYVMRPLTGQADPAAQLASLLGNPLSLLPIAVNTIRLSLGDYLWQFIGQLAWNDAPLPLPYLVLACVTLAACGMASMAGPASGRRWIVPACLCIIVGVHALLYFDWTPPGANRIDGVNGRHFIPLALAAGLALPSWKQGSRLRGLAASSLLLLGMTTPAVMIFHIIKHFYIIPA